MLNSDPVCIDWVTIQGRSLPYRAFACILLPWKRRPFWCTASIHFHCAPKWPTVAVAKLLLCCDIIIANALLILHPSHLAQPQWKHIRKPITSQSLLFIAKPVPFSNTYPLHHCLFCREPRHVSWSVEVSKKRAKTGHASSSEGRSSDSHMVGHGLTSITPKQVC